MYELNVAETFVAILLRIDFHNDAQSHTDSGRSKWAYVEVDIVWWVRMRENVFERWQNKRHMNIFSVE